MKVISTAGKIPIKLWLDDIEDGAMAQAKNLANLLLPKISVDEDTYAKQNNIKL